MAPRHGAQHGVVLQRVMDQAAALGPERVAAHVQLDQSAVGFDQRRERRRRRGAYTVLSHVLPLDLRVNCGN
jgi:hypothetical protein